MNKIIKGIGLVVPLLVSELFGQFELVMEGYYGITQHKTADGVGRMEIVVDMSKPAPPIEVYVSPKAGTNKDNVVTENIPQSENIVVSNTSVVDSVTSSRDVIMDSDANRELAARNSIINGAAGGGGGGCFLR